MVDAGPVTLLQVLQFQCQDCAFLLLLDPKKIALFCNGIAICSGCSDYCVILFMHTKCFASEMKFIFFFGHQDDIIVDPVESPEIVDDPFQTIGSLLAYNLFCLFKEEHGGMCFGWEFVPQGKLSYILEAEHHAENIRRIVFQFVWGICYLNDTKMIYGL
ncbi:hypothetical protein D8674_000122 [Pyrus ussuriensis x Pyrus communis]|uniref:Uncharacterized protein n=1 Tax=Pyrus ussuriensis x Pyrus communis TaxID=2448454 RepID=A0A5N5F7P6_9ROSA|nr:hypothetical protein D8674_000122 [Pyrus ussuriensis x Pyrus communis]